MTGARAYTWRLLAGVSLVAVAGALVARPAAAEPTGGTVVQSSGANPNTIVTSPNGGFSDVVITQGNDRIAIDWESFGILNGDTVNFAQPGNQAIALNRVIGSGGPIPQSIIDGVLTSNGQVWLLNPSGIAFGANANVDVGGLLATSADMDPATFIGLDPATDSYTFTGGAGTVSNAGDLDSVGLMALVAPLVTNSGDLTSSHGDVLLGGAEGFRIKFASTGRNNGGAFDELLVTDFIIDTGSSAAAGGDVVHQTSTGSAIGGRVIANASRVGGGAFLNMEGLVEAQDVGTLSGDVMLLGGVDLTAGALGTDATDAVKTDNMTIVAPGTATAMGTAVTNGSGAGPLSSGGGGSETANVVLTATTGDVTHSASLKASTGSVTVSAVNGDIDVGDVEAAGAITMTARDIDLTGTNRQVNATGGAVSLTVTAGDISSSTNVDIDGDSVTLTGTVTGTSIDIDADTGTLTADDLTATAGAVSVDGVGNVAVDDVTATTTARVVSSTGNVDVGNVSGTTGVTISGTDVDLTETSGSVQSSGGAVAITATGAGANNISSAGNIDIDGTSVTLTGNTTAPGNINVDAATGNVTATGSVISTGGLISIIADAGNAVLQAVQASGTTTLRANQISATTIEGLAVDLDADAGSITATNVTATAASAAIDATGDINVDDVSAGGTVRVVSSGGDVDVGNVSGTTGVTISGSDVDLTGTGGSVQSSIGAVSITATGAGANNISSTGAIDIDGFGVTLSGATTGTSIDIDAAAGTVTAGSLTATGGSASIDATSDVTVGDVSATTTVRVVSSLGNVDVGNVSGTTGVTISGSDVDLTGTGGSVQSSGGAVAITATGGGGNNISATDAMDIDGTSVTLTGNTTAPGDISVNATTGNATATGSVISTGGLVSIIANAGNAVLQAVSAVTGVTLTANQISATTVVGTTVDMDADAGSITANGVTATIGSAAIDATGDIDVDDVSAGTTARVVSTAGNVDVGDVTGPGGVTISGVDVDLTGAGSSVQSSGGAVAITATGAGANNISAPGTLDIDGASIVLKGAVQAGTGIDLDASSGGITATGGNMTTTTGTADLKAAGTASVQGITAPGNISIEAAIINFAGTLASQAEVFLTALTGSLTGSGTSAVTAPGGSLTARATGGAATLNNVNIAGNLSVIGGSVAMTGNSTVGGAASLQALTGNVNVAGTLNATGGVMLIEAPSGTAILNQIASSSDITLTVLDLDLTGTITAGDQFNLTSASTGMTIIFGGSGGTDGVTLRRPQGFTLDASELTRITAAKLQFNAGNNDVALLDATFDPTALKSLVLGADSNARIMAAGDVRGLPSLQLGFVDGATQARPDIVFISGSLGADTSADRLDEVRIEAARDIVIGTQAFFDAYEAANGDIDLSVLGEPDLGLFKATEGQVFIAADQLRLWAPEEIVQLNTGTSLTGAGVVFGEAPSGEGTIEKAGTGPERVNLFGVVVNAAGERVTSFEAGLEPNLLEPGLAQNGELRLNLCVIGDSSSCSIAILREAQESARSRNSALSSLTNNVFFGFEDDEDEEDDEDDLGGVAGAGNEGLWGVGLP